MTFDFEAGEVLLIDKPYEWSSFDVVRKIRNTFKMKKVGHAGTLDPLATGLLILCTGKKTKEIETYQGQEKEYEGLICLGKTTPSCDLETEFDQEFDISHITEDDIYRVASEFLGQQMQVPPCFSAIKVNGKRVYKLARKGINVEMKEREVFIKSFEIKKIDFPNIEFNIVCSKGTYIRSIARDFGEKLGAGSHLALLRRTRIGGFTIDKSYKLEDFLKLAGKKQGNEGL
ncbi:hypothetical protein MYP_2311 [Sporocytophaga myxococcoides]|uniref:tRNA pseudouridine synthase B n=1 Tax=Sporocytophaga myxococcoides TaxID=153721 RepID=A0A098LG62_9BACT|nr:tRNA pseudouridine(55) synthase TruB [Sporocytophaga myxococcoides]GAL85083.1 hypothetical protein MYP_2311 [Sporocytophaga myxococcoides]